MKDTLPLMRRQVLTASSVAFAAPILVGCETPGGGPLVHSGALSLELTAHKIPAGAAPFSTAKDVRTPETRVRKNTPLGEHYGDEDFAQQPIDALRAELSYAASLRLQSRRAFDALARSSLELKSFEAAYVAVLASELERLLSQQAIPVFRLLDRAAVAITGRQGCFILAAEVLVDGKAFSTRQVLQASGEPPPGKHLIVPYMERLGRQLLSQIIP